MAEEGRETIFTSSALTLSNTKGPLTMTLGEPAETEGEEPKDSQFRDYAFGADRPRGPNRRKGSRGHSWTPHLIERKREAVDSLELCWPVNEGERVYEKTRPGG